jgi:hypothetical protein
MIKATAKARTHMIDPGTLSDKQLKELETEYKRLCDGDERGDGAGGKAFEEELEERNLR